VGADASPASAEPFGVRFFEPLAFFAGVPGDAVEAFGRVSSAAVLFVAFAFFFFLVDALGEAFAVAFFFLVDALGEAFVGEAFEAPFWVVFSLVFFFAVPRFLVGVFFFDPGFFAGFFAVLRALFDGAFFAFAPSGGALAPVSRAPAAAVSTVTGAGALGGPWVATATEDRSASSNATPVAAGAGRSPIGSKLASSGSGARQPGRGSSPLGGIRRPGAGSLAPSSAERRSTVSRTTAGTGRPRSAC